MAGFDNEVLFAIGERLESSTAQAIGLMQAISTDVSRINYIGNPNNNVAANPSSISHDPVSGFLWLKVSGTGTTVWQRIEGAPTAGFVQTLTGNTGPAIPPDGAGNINVVLAHTNILVSGAGNTLTMDFKDPTFANLILGSDVAQTLNPLLAQNLTSVGSSALNSVISSKFCVALGGGSLQALTTGSFNTMVGSSSGANMLGAAFNSGCGYAVLNANVSGGANSAFGYGALVFALGSTNTALGTGAGNAYTGAESNNISIGNGGVLGESNKIRIGTDGGGVGQQNACYVAGITGVTVAGSAPIGVASTGQLSSLGFGTATQVLTSNGAATSPTWQGISSVFSWLDNSGAFAAAANTGYFLTAASTPTLPLAPAQGTVIEFAVVAAATMTITANTGQVIVLDGATSASAGTAVAATVGNTIKLVYRTVGTTWWATSSVGASWTIT